ncbi:MAG: hypothetical protein IKY12_00330 [Clostridia bacterium]|nr:hypothetical protein [Clostridia bacterium]
MTTLKDQVINATELWLKYEKCVANHTQMDLDEQTARAYRFYEGNQWYGLESGGEEMPVYNFIAPIVRYKTAMVAMNNMSITYSTPNADEKSQRICNALSGLALRNWERFKMDSKCWEAVKASIIAGDSYAYFYNGDGACQIVDRTDVFLADESNPDLNAQPYIFIKERKQVSEVRDTAIKNGIAKEIALSIQPDSDDDEIADDKCTSILMLELKSGNLHFKRFTKTVVYQPEQVIEGIECYPIASLVYSPKRSSARGIGEVTPLIANQIEVNRNLVRRLLNAKLTAYSRLVYASDRITNPKALTEVGTAIEVEGGGVNSIKDAVNYLTPSSMSPDAKTLSDELLSITKDLAGAGDAALGSVNPTEASGAAIIAVRDQAALPLNEQTARFKQFAEDIARIWYRLWLVYNPDGIELEEGKVTKTELLALCPDIRIDISNTSPYSKYAREQALEKLFTMDRISFEEYVSALDDDSSVPKSKLTHIIKNRGGSLIDSK